MRPKHHLFLEMGVRARWQGSPSLLSCWADESINKVVKEVAAMAHLSHFHERVLIEFEAAAGICAKRPRTG